MIGKILVAYDGSDNAGRALEVAAELSSRLGAELSIVHVLMHGRPAKELVRMAEIEHLVETVHREHFPEVNYVTGNAYDVLSTEPTDDTSARIISALGDQLVGTARNRCKDLGVPDAKTSVRKGDYADEIVDAANEIGADMIVMGSRGLGPVKRAVLGSVSQKVLHEAKQTVVAVK